MRDDRSNSTTAHATNSHRPAGTRKETAAYLTANSFKISKSTLDKRNMEGRGPPVAYRWCGRDFYYFDEALDWARANCCRPGNTPTLTDDAAPRRRGRKPKQPPSPHDCAPSLPPDRAEQQPATATSV
jgi:hypothetical protein